MIEWQYFPKSRKPPRLATDVVAVFDAAHASFESPLYSFKSNEVLARVAEGLAALGFTVETGKKASQKIRVPVLFGPNGVAEKCFDADAHHVESGFVLEVEAGRAIVNNQFLKDVFEACMMHDVTELAIAVRRDYNGAKDYVGMIRFLDTLYASHRLALPLKGILAIGY